MAKFVLEMDYDYDFDLIGIACHSKDYRLVWSLNRFLDYDFSRNRNDLEVQVNRKKESVLQSFPIFNYINPLTDSEYHLISNNSGNGWLLPEQQNIDYFLMIHNRYNEEISTILDKLRAINMVLIATEINVYELKSRENLLF